LIAGIACSVPPIHEVTTLACTETASKIMEVKVFLLNRI
jgi:hypothetical protein